MTVETMPEDEFQRFFAWLPTRVQLLVKGGMVDWREVLPEWLEKYEAEFNNLLQEALECN